MSTGIINSCKCTKNEPKIADRDIVCYKIIRRMADGTAKGLYVDKDYLDVNVGTYEIPSIEIIYNGWFAKNILRKGNIKKVIEEKVEWNKEYKWWDIISGYLHSTPNEINKDNFYNYLPWFLPIGTVIEVWKCIIPKGTKYYQADCRGSHYESSNSYASKKLMFKELILSENIDINKCGGAKY